MFFSFTSDLIPYKQRPQACVGKCWYKIQTDRIISSTYTTQKHRKYRQTDNFRYIPAYYLGLWKYINTQNPKFTFALPKHLFIEYLLKNLTYSTVILCITWEISPRAWWPSTMTNTKTLYLYGFQTKIPSPFTVRRQNNFIVYAAEAVPRHKQRKGCRQ